MGFASSHRAVKDQVFLLSDEPSAAKLCAGEIRRKSQILKVIALKSLVDRKTGFAQKPGSPHLFSISHLASQDMEGEFLLGG